MKSFVSILLLAALIVSIGCGGSSSQSPNNNGQTPILKSIQISSTPASVPAGLTLPLRATGTYSDGTTKDLSASVVWTSSAPNIATIASTGVLTGKSQGSATITATSNSITGKTSISVTAALVKAITAIHSSYSTIAALTQEQFRATATLTDGSSADITHLVTWTVSPTTFASISNFAPTQGLVTAGDPPSNTAVTVTATCSLPACVAQSGTPTLSVTLTVTNASPVSISVTPASKTIGWGTQLQLTATATFSDNTTQDITNVCGVTCVNWTSSLPKTVLVTASSGLAVGEAVGGPSSISVSFRGVVSNTVFISVDLSNLVSISVKPAQPTIANGTKLSFSAIGTFVDGSTRNLAASNAVSWSSSDTSIATISGASASGIGPGTTTITASAGSINGATDLDVQNATLQSLAVAPTSALIPVGTQLGYTAVGTFMGCSVCPFQQALTGQSTTAWSSSTAAASFGANAGVATGNAAGNTVITASSSLPPGNISASVPLTVTSATLVAIDLTPADTFFPPGVTQTYTATGTFSDGSTQNVSAQATWSSSNSNVAAVNGSQVTTQGQGSAKISATWNGIKGTTSLLVTSSPLQSITITPANAKVAENTEAQFKATGNFQDGTVQNLTTSVTWTSGDKVVATVGADSGILTALSPGTTSLSATYLQVPVSGTTNVTVSNATLVSITLKPGNTTVSAGGSVTFTAGGKFSDGTTQTLINANWKSSDPNVAIVTTWGLATSSGKGTTMISAALNGVTGTAILTVQ